MASAVMQRPGSSRTPARQTDGANGSPAAMPQVDDLPPQVAKDLVGVFKLLSDETRLRILHFLMQAEECNVRTLCDLLGQSQPAVSHHLALLRVGGLIDLRRDGKHNYYSITPARVREVMEQLFAISPGGPDRVELGGCVINLHATA